MDKVRIFIDFWNLQLNINEHTRGYKLDWKKLSPLLTEETTRLLDTPLRFDGSIVYLSYNPGTPQGSRLRHWSSNVLDRFPGIRVVSKERKAKMPPRCPYCHQLIEYCPHCGNKISGTVEKGIDTAIVTDMIKLAWEGAWDVAVLVSSDRDFISMPCHVEVGLDVSRLDPRIGHRLHYILLQRDEDDQRRQRHHQTGGGDRAVPRHYPRPVRPRGEREGQSQQKYGE